MKKNQSITKEYNKSYKEIVQGVKSLVLYLMPDLASHIQKYIIDKPTNENIYATIDLKTNEININLEKIYQAFLEYKEQKLKEDEATESNYTEEEYRRGLLLFILANYTHQITHFALKHYTRETKLFNYLKNNNLPVNQKILRWLVEYECNSVLFDILDAAEKKAEEYSLSLSSGFCRIADFFEFLNIPSMFCTTKINDIDLHELLELSINNIDINDEEKEMKKELSPTDFPFEDLYLSLLKNHRELLEQNLSFNICELEIVKDREITKDQIEMEQLVDINDIEGFIKTYGTGSANLVTKVRKKLKKVSVPSFKSMAFVLKSIGNIVRETYQRMSYKTNNFLNVYKGKERKQYTYPIGIVIDTSGSVTEKQLENVYSFIREMFKVANYLKLIYIDTEVSKVLEITDSSQIEKEDINIFTGRGGTDMNPAIDLLEKDKNIKHIFILTDGFIPDIERKRKPIWMMLYNATDSTSEVAEKCNIPYYYLTSE